ncbi:MAG: MOSC domain-containing protein [Solirubrobacterales bacterium]|nr:MOSC domain-containing protein [Solirubrobacterales bacterium]
MNEIVVSGLTLAPVKGMRLASVERISLGLSGVRENRRFFWIDERDRLVNGKMLGGLQSVVAEYEDSARWLRLTLSDGTVVEGEVRAGKPVITRFYSQTLEARVVSGPWSEAVSACLGRPLRLVEAGEAGAVDRGADGAASAISRASLARLAEQAGETGELDARRFRMLIEVDGLAAHAEDEWVGRTVRIGEARVVFRGHVGRCLTTSRNPDTGVVDLPTLDLLRSYRGERAATEPLPFGVYGRPVTPGRIAVGDPIVVDE